MGILWELPHSGNQHKPEAKACSAGLALLLLGGTQAQISSSTQPCSNTDATVAWLAGDGSASLWDPEQGWFCHRLAITEPALLL